MAVAMAVEEFSRLPIIPPERVEAGEVISGMKSTGYKKLEIGGVGNMLANEGLGVEDGLDPLRGDNVPNPELERDLE